MENRYWALILGGSSGLGLATAKKLASHGYHIIIIHRDRRADMDIIEEHFKEIEAFGNQLLAMNVDALNAEKRKGIIDNIRQKLPFGHKIKVMVHSMAKGTLKPMYSKTALTLTDTDFRITFDAMALSLFDWTKALETAGLFADDTRVISFTSEGNTKALPNYSAVSVAKVALEALTRSIALEFASVGIKANCIQAGITMTKSLSMIPGFEQIKENALSRNPNNRLTTPEDIANAVYLLTTDEAKWITGTVIKVDGGESLL
ncbi:NAD(P)-dependent dehydrogenase, short-chain alcohol dehydrogenase family [Maribacter dokdonensis]|uniref:NAD(P)-dependent dehydrogenase, short-chain alcohol dehydrogenase family n=1 Tax=Maribacter dokdonensis TaxID=320912 RepID=A0A1H4SR68_9FLAO|nr:SDR family oxidoreductase [Maribacter dokdonensis]SEC46683.1 NAD(P)-dependent dehydrogenase, short-chain alcohol dehydrogenase family [Maribacter dokdonensis]